MDENIKQEVIKRMRYLEIIEDTIQQVAEHQLISYSLRGGNYWLDERLKSVVKTFEMEYGHTPYYAILNHTEFGELLSIFFVSADEEMWSGEWLEMEHNTMFVYVHNLDVPEFSEFGTIGFARVGGGLIRKW